MMLTFKTGLTAPEGFLDKVFDIDKVSYSKELCGIIENLYKRYERCADSYVLAYDGDVLVGYVSVFPVSEELYIQVNDPNYLDFRDDDIEPHEMDEWRKNKKNDLFILSVAIRPEYRDGEAIKFLCSKLLEFLRDKEDNGYIIGSIAGYAVSEGGEEFMQRFRCEYVKETEDDDKYYLANRHNVKELMDYGLLQKDF